MERFFQTEKWESKHFQVCIKEHARISRLLTEILSDLIRFSVKVFAFLMNRPKKGELVVRFCCLVYRLLSISTITIVATTIVIMITMVAGNRYMSAIDSGSGVGIGVAAGPSSTFM